MITTDAVSESGALTLEERRQTLQRVLASDTASGWRVLSQTDTTAQLEKGKNTSHGLHIFLSIITLGLWVPVWILIAVTTGRKQRYVQVDEYGNVSRT